MKIFIIILNWNGKEDTIKCLKSLEEIPTPHQVVMVDNGSTDGSVKEISRAFPKIHLIETNKNLGYAEGNNIGIRYALKEGADFIFILNNDTTVTRNILEAFLKRDIPVQGGKALLMNEPTLIDHLGGNWNTKRGQFDLIAEKGPEKDWISPLSLDYVCGVALFVKREVFEKVGFFDPRFFLFWEEADWCCRAKREGFAIQVCPEAILYHKRSASFTGGRPHTNYFWWRNRLLYIEKNLSAKERKKLQRTIVKEALHALKLYMIKSFVFRFGKKTEKHFSLLRFYRSLIAGVRDYFFRRFGNCPSWLSQK